MQGQIQILNLPTRPIYTINSGDFLVLGRGRNADIILEKDNSVSRLHCKIYYQKKQFWIEDLGSRNRTVLNSKPISIRQALAHKSKFRIGKYSLLFTIKEFPQALPLENDQEVFAQIKRQDKLLGKIAMKLELLSKADLNKTVELQEEMAEEGPYIDLADILLQEHYLSINDLKKIQNYKTDDSFRVPGYKLQELIGFGGMGRIYTGRQLSTGEVVAIKILSDVDDKNKMQMSQQFIQEAKAIAKLDHINIVSGIDFGFSGKHIYIVMEYVDGPTLSQAVKEEGGRFLPDKALDIIKQVARALEHAHQRNLVHRDIKTENILLTFDHVAKLCDFGLVREVGVRDEIDQVFGTVAFMSPEQCKGKVEVDIRSDIYSLGTVFYRILFGRLPFVGSKQEIRDQHVHKPLVFPNEGRHHQKIELAKIIQKMMAKKPSQRYQTPEELLSALKEQDKLFEKFDISNTEEISVFEIEQKSSSKDLSFEATEIRPIPYVNETQAIFAANLNLKNRNKWLIALITLVFVSLAFFWWQRHREEQSNEKLLHDKITQSLENSTEQTLAFYQEYRVLYGEHSRHTLLKEKIQSSLYKKAWEAKEQKAPIQASFLCQKILEIDKETSLAQQASKLQKQIQQDSRLLQKEKRFWESYRQVQLSMEKAIKTGVEEDWEKAQEKLSRMNSRPLPKEFKKEFKKELKKLTRELYDAREKEKLLHYRFYPAEELKLPPQKKDSTILAVQMEKLHLGAQTSFSSLKKAFFQFQDKYIYCLNPKNGETLWTHHLGSLAQVQFIFLNDFKVTKNMEEIDHILVSSPEQSAIWLFDIRGKLVWSCILPQTIRSKLHYHSQKLFVACQGGNLYQIFLATGEIQGAFCTVGESSYFTIHPKTNGLYIASEDGYIYGFHAIDGKLLSRTPYEGVCQAIRWGNDKRIVMLVKKVNNKVEKEKKKQIIVYDTSKVSHWNLTKKETYDFPPKTIKEYVFEDLVFAVTSTNEIFSLNLSFPSPSWDNFHFWKKTENFLFTENPLKKHSFYLITNSIEKLEFDPKIKKIKIQTSFPFSAKITPASSLQKSSGLIYLSSLHYPQSKDLLTLAMKEDGKKIWLRRLSLSIQPSKAITQDKNLWLSRTDGALVFSKASPSQILPRYKISAGHPVIPIQTNLELLSQPGTPDRILVLRDKGKSKVIDSRGKTIRLFTPRLKIHSDEFLGLSSYQQKILFLAHKDQLSILSLKNGKPLYSSYHSSSSLTTKPLFYKGSLFVGNAKGELLHLRLTGKKSKQCKLYWKYASEGAIHTSPIVSQNKIYSANEKGQFFALHIQNKKLLWQYLGLAPIHSQVLFYQDKFYFGDDEGYIQALDLQGKLLWRTQVPGAIIHKPIIYGKRIYFVNTLSECFGLDKDKGELIWKEKISGGEITAYFHYNRCLYMGTDRGFLYVVRDIALKK